MELTASNVNEVFMDCLFKSKPEPGTKFIPARGIVTNVGFVPKKIDDYSLTIKMMLDELDDTFKEDKGGGWSFLQMAATKSGEQWADHRTMEQLMLLGIAAGWLKYLLPREMWSALSGGVPYVVFVKDRIKVKEETYAVQ